jgi:tetratricopeptide (TPR) repeat protein
VLCLEDRWQEGLAAAEKAWELCPGMPQGSTTLGRIVAKLHGIPAAVSRLLEVAKQKQSYETLLTAIHYLCADAERRAGDDGDRLARQALKLADRLDSLAPLKDEELKSYLALMRIDIAWLLNDHQTMRAQDKDVRHPFYQAILKNKVLAQIVLKKRLPGIRATQKWQYPPAEYVAQYAAQVGMVKSENATALQMLWDAIEREPIHAGSYHALGDLHRQEGDFKKSILPYRCAATLELENHHYSRGYLDALAKVGLFKEGIDFLKRRTEKLGGSVAGGQVWMTLIDAYEDYGYPDEAIDARSGSSC